MELALKILNEAKEKLAIEKRFWLKQKDHNITDKINEEILDISIAIKILVGNGKIKKSND